MRNFLLALIPVLVVLLVQAAFRLAFLPVRMVRSLFRRRPAAAGIR